MMQKHYNQNENTMVQLNMLSGRNKSPYLRYSDKSQNLLISPRFSSVVFPKNQHSYVGTRLLSFLGPMVVMAGDVAIMAANSISGLYISSPLSLHCPAPRHNPVQQRCLLSCLVRHGLTTYHSTCSVLWSDQRQLQFLCRWHDRLLLHVSSRWPNRHLSLVPRRWTNRHHLHWWSD